MAMPDEIWAIPEFTNPKHTKSFKFGEWTDGKPDLLYCKSYLYQSDAKYKALEARIDELEKENKIIKDSKAELANKLLKIIGEKK